MSDAQISINDAGFLYGDGIFETIRFQNRALFRPEKHLQRLRDGLRSIKLKLNYSDEYLINLLNEAIKKNELNRGLLRMIITRGLITGTPWNDPENPSIYILPRRLSVEPKVPVKIVYFKEELYPLIRIVPAIKSVNYLGNMLAKKDAQNVGAFEPIFINRDGLITEGAIRNIFYIRDKSLISPSLKLGVLPGVMRETVIEVASQLNIKFEEDHIPYADVNKMDEAFISSSGIGILPCFWEGWTSKFKITRIIKNKIDMILENTFK